MRLKSLFIVLLLIVVANITFSFQISKTWRKKIEITTTTFPRQHCQTANRSACHALICLAFWQFSASENAIFWNKWVFDGKDVNFSTFLQLTESQSLVICQHTFFLWYYWFALVRKPFWPYQHALLTTSETVSDHYRNRFWSLQKAFLIRRQWFLLDFTSLFCSKAAIILSRIQEKVDRLL